MLKIYHDIIDSCIFLFHNLSQYGMDLQSSENINLNLAGGWFSDVSTLSQSFGFGTHMGFELYMRC